MYIERERARDNYFVAYIFAFLTNYFSYASVSVSDKPVRVSHTIFSSYASLSGAALAKGSAHMPSEGLRRTLC